MLVDAWLKVVGAFTPEDMESLKARGCASELLAFLDAFDKLVLAWRQTEAPPLDKKVGGDVQIRLRALRDALCER